MALGVALGIAVLVVGLVMVVPLGLAMLRGEPLVGMKAGKIADLRRGNALLCGHIEPAWSYLKSPIAGIPCVYYDTLATVYYGRDLRTIFHRRNGVPFILNDGTGRIAVLARHAMWDLASGSLDRGDGSGEVERVARAETADQVRTLLDRQFADPPEPLSDERDSSYSDDDVRKFAKERTLAIGELVTVIGAVTELPAGTLTDEGIGDDGSSVGLAGRPAIAGRAMGPVSVLVGTPDQVAGRVRMRLALAGLGIVVAAVAMGFLLMLANSPS